MTRYLISFPSEAMGFPEEDLESVANSALNVSAATETWSGRRHCAAHARVLPARAGSHDIRRPRHRRGRASGLAPHSIYLDVRSRVSAMKQHR
jgi:hypothetical protein